MVATAPLIGVKRDEPNRCLQAEIGALKKQLRNCVDVEIPPKPAQKDQSSCLFDIQRLADLKKGLKSNGGYRPCFLRTLPKHGRSSGRRSLARNSIALSSNKICAVWRHKVVS
jgi:hypothetical protein